MNIIDSARAIYHRHCNRIDTRPGRMTISDAFWQKRDNKAISLVTRDKLYAVFTTTLRGTSNCVPNEASIKATEHELSLVKGPIDGMKHSPAQKELRYVLNAMNDDVAAARLALGLQRTTSPVAAAPASFVHASEPLPTLLRQLSTSSAEWSDGESSGYHTQAEEPSPTVRVTFRSEDALIDCFQRTSALKPQQRARTGTLTGR